MSVATPDRMCYELKEISGSDWIAVKFLKHIAANACGRLRFCEAVSMAKNRNISLSITDINCDGARRCFGRFTDSDLELAEKLSSKMPANLNNVCKLLNKTPVLGSDFVAIDLGKDIAGDVYISYAEPECVMKLTRRYQKMTGNNLVVEISGIMSVCGNVAVRCYFTDKISLSFGCPDSRKYGGLEKTQLAIGLPHNVARAICNMKNN